MKKTNILIVLIAIITFQAQAQSFSYKEYKEFKDFPDYVMDAHFSAYGNYFVLTIGDNTTMLYDKDLNKIWEHKGSPESKGSRVAFSPDENYMAIGKFKTKNDIGIIYLPDLEVIQVLKGHADYVNNVDFNHKGNVLATASNDNKVFLWKLKGKEFEKFQVLEEHDKSVEAVEFSYDDKFLATAGQSRKVIFYEMKGENYTYLNEIPKRHYSEGMAFHPSKYEVALGTSGYIKILDFDGKQFFEKDSLTDFSGTNYAVNFSPKGDYLTATSMYGHVYIWKYDGKKYVQDEVIRRHSWCAFYAGFSDDGKYFTTASKDGSAIIWQLEGIEASDKAKIVDYLGENITFAQKNALTLENQEKILKSINPELSKPKSEFETTEQYNKRREKLSAEVKRIIQEQTEKHYGMKIKAKENLAYVTTVIPIEYDADNQLYEIKFLDINAKVELPMEEAKSFKEKSSKAQIVIKRKLSKDNISYTYEDFKLLHPSSGKEYKVTVNENPLTGEVKRYASNDEGNNPENNLHTADAGDSLSLGNTYALLIATSDYEFFTDLPNPVKDAETIATELKDNYGVTVEIIKDPTLNETLKKIRDYAARSYNKYDQLLIFIAGHGNYDEIFKEGYLIAKNSKPGDDAKTTQLAHSNLRTIINNIPCNHIFLIMDACFGGTFDPMIASRAGDMYDDIPRIEFIKRKLKFKTRLYLTSGGKEYVPDGRPGHHSPFARKLLEALRTYGGEDGILTIGEIKLFIEKVNPEPRYGEFGDNDPGSDFLLISK